MWDNPEEEPEVENQEVEPDTYVEVMMSVETQYQCTRRRLWALFMVLLILSLFASYWLAITTGGVQYWAATIVFSVLGVLQSGVGYQKTSD